MNEHRLDSMGAEHILNGSNLPTAFLGMLRKATPIEEENKSHYP